MTKEYHRNHNLKFSFSFIRKLLPSWKSSHVHVIEIKDPNIDATKLDDTDFEYFYPDQVLVKIPRAMLEKLTEEELNEILDGKGNNVEFERQTSLGRLEPRKKEKSWCRQYGEGKIECSSSSLFSELDKDKDINNTPSLITQSSSMAILSLLKY